MIEKNFHDIGTLLLAFITGLAINGTFSVLFSAFVPFSIFPIISLGLASWCLYQRYLNRNMLDGVPSLAAAFFLLGILVYSVLIRIEYPEIGSNIIPIIILIAISGWIVIRFFQVKK